MPINPAGAVARPMLRNAFASAEFIAEKARAIRIASLKMVFEAHQGHPGGDLSVADILATLYFGVMRYDPALPNEAGRDRFVMSKGHCTGALYSTLAEAGFFPRSELATYLQPLSMLNGHPNRNYLPGVETNTGPLGHGMPVAVGMAIAAQIDRADFRVFVVTGDGELQEGANWEAAMAAGHYKLSTLTLIIDRNRLQQGDSVENTNTLEPLADKWRAFGWEVREVDGHDHAALLGVLSAPADKRERPLCVIAHTTKGRGVSFMEGEVRWHHGAMSESQFATAMAELGA